MSSVFCFLFSVSLPFDFYTSVTTWPLRCLFLVFILILSKKVMGSIFFFFFFYKNWNEISN